MYPTKHHTDHDVSCAHDIIERFPLGTMVSSRDGELLVTQVPLMLDRTHGSLGKLTGHIDKRNPQVIHLNGGSEVCVVFHGPNGYVSPSAYQTKQLPTWNSISVHVHGAVKVQKTQEEVRHSLLAMTNALEEKAQTPYVLASDDPVMAKMLPLIEGFEIDIQSVVGRYKLSQDKNKTDMNLANAFMLDWFHKANKSIVDELTNP